MKFQVMAEIEASEFFEDGKTVNVNWEWCVKHATFSHLDACEFILHCGDGTRDEGNTDGSGNDTYAERKADQMRASGCTESFIAAYLAAANAGAMRVLFYV